LEASRGKYFSRPYLKKPFTKIGLVERLKVKALSSSPSTAKKKGRNTSMYTPYKQRYSLTCSTTIKIGKLILI
jgi:hypothetical protein